MEEKTSELGAYLRQSRTKNRLTLRGVEEATGVSNAYLSQLESGKIQKPSPAILFKLCQLYGASYPAAMRYAGHPVPGEEVSGAGPEREQENAIGAGRFAARLGPTTQDEEAALLEYLAFLRSKRTRQR